MKETNILKEKNESIFSQCLYKLVISQVSNEPMDFCFVYGNLFEHYSYNFNSWLKSENILCICLNQKCDNFIDLHKF